VSAAALLGLLAEPDRLRVVAALVLGARTTSEVLERAGLDQRAGVAALNRLHRGGLVTVVDHAWVLHAELLKEEARAAAPVEPEGAAAYGTTDQRAVAVLRSFVRDGRLVSIPTTRAKRIIVLDHLSRAFEVGRRYPEKEVDVALRAWHPDHAALRRHLVDEGFLTREAGVYWRTGGAVEV